MLTRIGGPLLKLKKTAPGRTRPENKAIHYSGRNSRAGLPLWRLPVEQNHQAPGRLVALVADRMRHIDGIACRLSGLDWIARLTAGDDEQARQHGEMLDRTGRVRGAIEPAMAGDLDIVPFNRAGKARWAENPQLAGAIGAADFRRMRRRDDFDGACAGTRLARLQKHGK